MSDIVRQRAVWKYNASSPGSFKLLMPIRSEVLCVRTQRGVPMLWALVDPDETFLETRRFLWVGTGERFAAAYPRYVGTIESCGGYLIWHLFEDRS